MALHYESMVHNIEFDHGATESRRRAEHARAYLPPEGGSYKRILALGTLARWHPGTLALFSGCGRAPAEGRHRARIEISENKLEGFRLSLFVGDLDPCRPRERGPATSIRASL